MTGKSAIEATESRIAVAVLCCLLVAVPVAGVAGGQPATQATHQASAATASVDGSGASLDAGPLSQTNESSANDTDAGAGTDSDGNESRDGANRTENATAENGTADDGTAEDGTPEEPPLIESFTATTQGTNVTVRVESSERLRQIVVGVYDIDGDVVAEHESNFHVGMEYVTTFNLSNETYRTSIVTAKSYNRRVDDPTSHSALVTVSSPESSEAESITSETGANRTTGDANSGTEETETPEGDSAETTAGNETADSDAGGSDTGSGTERDSGTETAAENRTTSSEPVSTGTADPTTVETKEPTTPVVTTTVASGADTGTSRGARSAAGTTRPPETRAAAADDGSSEPRHRTQGALVGSPLLQSVLTLVAAAALALLSVVLWIRG